MTNKTTIVVTAEDRASAVFRGLRGSVESTAASFASFGAAFAGLGGAAAIAGVTRLVSTLDDLADTAKGIGLSAEDLSAFQFSARAAGVSSEELTGGLSKFAQVLEDARNGSEEAERTVAALGIGLGELRSGTLTTEGALERAADALSKYADGFEKTALARDAFGRGGAKFITFLSEGSDGLRKFGGVSRDAIEEAGKLQNEIDKLSASWDQLKLSVAGSIAGIVNATLELKRGSLDSQLATTQKAIEEISETLERTKPGSRLERNLLEQLKVEQNKLQELERTIAKREFVGPPELGGRPPDRKPKTRDKTEKERAEDISESRRELAAFVSQLERERDIIEEISLKERAIQTLRANPSIDTPQVRELLFLEIERVEAARQEKELREELARIQKEELEKTRQLDAQLDEFSGRTAEALKIAQAARLEARLASGEIFSAEELEKTVKGIAGIRDEVDRTKDATDQLALAFSSSLGRFIESGGAGGIKSFFESLLQDVLKLTTQLLIIEPLTRALTQSLRGSGESGGLGSILSSIGGFLGFGGARAMGGPVAAGMGYLVGERGPELFVPRSSGQIVPNGGGSMNINVNLPPGTNVTRQTANQIGLAVGRQLSMAGRRNG
ncbi:MAG: hypothetical protein ACK5YV_15070 [Betaproteobacteria bacterium]|jgi:hypothetical protein